MTEDLPPIDGNAWSTYTRSGRAHFERVQRSWVVFWRNANELVGLLHSVETNVVASLALMQDRQEGTEEERRARQAFWDELDQRLHNLLASAVSLVDHTRPLVDFYVYEPVFQQEFRSRNDAVAQSPRASFLRNLRNYLLHKGVAPLMQTMRLETTAADEWDHLRIQLSGDGLLRWPKWNAKQRGFIQSFDGGPPLRDVCVGYAEDMRDVYVWLFQQHAVLHPPGVVPQHLRTGRADHIVYGPEDAASETEA